MFLVISVSSCVAPRNFVYFHNLKKDTLHPGVIVMDSITKFHDPKIEINDILNITVSVFNPLSEDETLGKSVSGKNPDNTSNTYLVDKDGYVELRLVGFVKVVGLTTSEIRELVKQKAKEFYRDPIVNVTLANFEITVVGEVVRPGAVSVKSEKASILDVLALAGDLKSTAKRKNILLARTENNQVTFARLDITSTDIYKSPYFYVKQRDYIYVEPNYYTQQGTDASFSRYAGYATSLIGVFTVLVLTNVIKINKGTTDNTTGNQ